MKWFAFYFFVVLVRVSGLAQPASQLSGIVKSAANQEVLAGASITIYSGGTVSGLVANKEGKFMLAIDAVFDSIKISMVGHESRIFYKTKIGDRLFIEAMLTVVPAALPEVVIRPLTAMDVIKKTIAKISINQPQQDFENKGFYREVIKDRENYFSVAEAIFTAQYYPAKKEYKLKLEQGRSKEDVSYTRLFEDYHPGGGPQVAAGNSFVTGRPAFLDMKKINDFTYKIDSVVFFDGRRMYQVSFDQKVGVKKALEKGTMLIDKEDFAVVRFDAVNSPQGTPYIKNLTGTDKIVADILNIDFKNKGWKRRADFSRVYEKWVLNYAETEYAIGYRQPKKNLDLDLVIHIELAFSELSKTIDKEITKGEEWKRKNLVANLPTDFDAAFWGGNNIISPTEELKNIIASLAKQDGAMPVTAVIDDWQYLNRNLFVSYKQTDTITLIPVMKCLWEDEETAGMIFREMQGDFIIESKIRLIKNSDSSRAPDRGFQQGGILVRSNNKGKENYVLLSVGTGGNAGPKLFFKRTIDNKSKTVVDKNETMNGWLRIEKTGKKITAYFKEGDNHDFKKAGEYNLEWLNGKVQTGLAVFAAFGGDGPKMRPDMRACFSELKIEKK